MKESTLPISNSLIENDKMGFIDRIARSMVHSQLGAISCGEIVIVEKGAESRFGKPTRGLPISVRIEVLHPSVWRDVAFAGSTGSGEAYRKGSWTCDDLTALVRIFLRNREALEGLDKHTTRFRAPLYKLIQWLTRNTRTGSRRNISVHYDLGNELFGLFLDPSMMYSCAYYEHSGVNLEEASVAKIDRICQKLDLKPSDHLLEIGTGWGGFAIYAASKYGCRVTTTTISQRQYEHASKRVAEAGLQDRITLLFDDYRDLQGQYDKLVSIEMIEAIGHQYLKTYFRKCNSLLKPDGMMLIQAITITDQFYKAALREVDFIKKYIFPGGFLPSITEMANAVTRVTDMKMSYLEDIGPHYARTLADWRQRFFVSLEKVKRLGYSDNFVRMWEYYLCYCEGSFAERYIGTVQMLLVKPQSRHEMVGV
jgi:cyclopropane-fatty-acyl-phospholipid synthase